jgi:hypothetical protein
MLRISLRIVLARFVLARFMCAVTLYQSSNFAGSLFSVFYGGSFIIVFTLPLSLLIVFFVLCLVDSETAEEHPQIITIACISETRSLPVVVSL